MDFETNVVSVTLRIDGPYHGVSRLLHKPTNRQVIDPRYSALNLYRLFSQNNGMGQPRTMDRTWRKGDGWVEITWPSCEAHHGKITARYEVVPPAAVEVSITMESGGTYVDYEVFMPSYFDKTLVPHVFLKPVRGSSGSSDRVIPTVSDVFRGTVLVFARDAPAARRCVDGRWTRSEFSSSTVQMCPVRYYAHCLAFAKDPNGPLAAVLMASPRDCYAISARYHVHSEADRMVTYTAFDMSLFGDDFSPGDRRTVKARLELVELDGAMSRPLELYQKYLGTYAASSRVPTRDLQS